MPPDGPSDTPLRTAAQAAGDRAVAAFQRLGSDLRLAILVALWEEVGPFAEENRVSFSSLRSRVGNPDSGQFNYHLDQLTDSFVLQSDAGYQLSPAGFHIVAAVIAGTGTAEAAMGPVEVEANCPLCASTVEIHAEHEMVSARCTECAGLWSEAFGTPGLLFRFALPPAALTDRTPTEVFGTTLTYNLNRVSSFRNGVCPVCAGPVDHSFDVCDSHAASGEPCPECGRRHLSEVLIGCKRCKTAVRDPVFMAALTHPAVTAFLYEHGINHRYDTWDAFSRGVASSETLESEDPLRVRVVIPCEGDELSLVLRGEDGITDLRVER